MSILNKGPAPCDLQLNTLVLLVEVQCLLGSGRGLDHAVLIFAFWCPCFRLIDQCTNIMYCRCFSSSSYEPKKELFLLLTDMDWVHSPHLSFRFYLQIMATRIWRTLNHFEIVLKFVSSSWTYSCMVTVWILFIFSGAIISTLQLLPTLHRPAFTQLYSCYRAVIWNKCASALT